MIAHMIRAILFARATAVAMRDLRPPGGPSQLSGMTPFSNDPENPAQGADDQQLADPSGPFYLPHHCAVYHPWIAAAARGRATMRQSSAAGEGAQIRSKCHHRTSRDRPDTWHRAQTPHLNVFLSSVAQPEGQVLDLRRKKIDLINIELSGDGNLTRPVLQQGRYLLEMGWLSRKDQAELGQVASQRIDQPRALADEALVGSEGHRSCLMFGAFHRHAMHGRAQHGFGDRRGVCRIVLLPLDERLHIDGQNRSDIVAAVLYSATQIVAGRTSFRRHDARRRRVQHLPLPTVAQRSKSDDSDNRLAGIASIPGQGGFPVQLSTVTTLLVQNSILIISPSPTCQCCLCRLCQRA